MTPFYTTLEVTHPCPALGVETGDHVVIEHGDGGHRLFRHHILESGDSLVSEIHAPNIFATAIALGWRVRTDIAASVPQPATQQGHPVTEADVDAALAALAEPPTVWEESARAVLLRVGDTATARAHRRVRQKLERRLEHKCDCCGTWHQRLPGRPYHYRCADCTAANLRPCSDCCQAFTPDKVQRRRCPACRAGDKART